MKGGLGGRGKDKEERKTGSACLCAVVWMSGLMWDISKQELNGKRSEIITLIRVVMSTKQAGEDDKKQAGKKAKPPIDIWHTTVLVLTVVSALLCLSLYPKLFFKARASS